MAFVLTFCLTLATGLVLLGLFRSRSNPEEETAGQARGRGPMRPREEGATEIAETLAIEKANGVAFTIFRAGTLLPTAYAENFGTVDHGTVDHGQRAIQLRLLAGTSQRASECRTLLNLIVPLKYPDLPVEPQVKVFLHVSEDGALAVHALEQGASRLVDPAALRIPVKASDRKRPHSWPLLPIKRLLAIAPFAYFGYVLYSDIDQSGLSGWIASLSMRWFHASYDIPNVLLAWALYVPLAASLARALVFAMPGLARSLAWEAVRVPRRPSVVPARAPGSSSVKGRPNGLLIVASVTLLFAWLVVSFGLLAGAIAFASWTLAEQRRAFAPALNLDTFSGTAPASPRVELEGWFHKELAARYESFVGPDRPRRGSTYRRDHVFTPVTSADWKPGGPVSVLLETTAEERDDGYLLGRSIHWKPGGDPGSVLGQRTGDVAAAPDRTTVNVRLRANDLPYFVKDAYEHAGMRFTHPYWVADTDEDARPLALALICALLVSVFSMTLVAMHFVKRARRPGALS